MSLSTLNRQAVGLLQMGRPDEGVSLLLEAFDQMNIPGNDGACACAEEAASHDFDSETAESTSQLLLSFTKSTSDDGRNNKSQKYFPEKGDSAFALLEASKSEESRYQVAVNRATQAHLRLGESRSMDSDNAVAPRGLTYDDSEEDVQEIVSSVSSDLSEEDEVSQGGNAGDDFSDSDGDQDPATTTHDDTQPNNDTETSRSSTQSTLQSVPLPEFREPELDGTEEDRQLALQTSQQRVSDNIFTFYQRAFILIKNTETDEAGTSLQPKDDNNDEDDDNNDEEDEEDKSSCPKQSAVLFYNLAVAHHNSAIHRQDPVASHDELRTALEYYDMVFSIIQESWDEHVDDLHLGEDYVLLLLAVMNNMGHIHAHWYNYLETQEMLTSLQEILQAVRSPSPFLDSDDFLFFYKNLVVYEEQEFAAAPAA